MILSSKKKYRKSTVMTIIVTKFLRSNWYFSFILRPKQLISSFSLFFVNGCISGFQIEKRKKMSKISKKWFFHQNKGPFMALFILSQLKVRRDAIYSSKVLNKDNKKIYYFSKLFVNDGNTESELTNHFVVGSTTWVQWQIVWCHFIFSKAMQSLYLTNWKTIWFLLWCIASFKIWSFSLLNSKR